VSLFIWVITFDLSGMGGPNSNTRYRQHSSQDHVTSQAPPLRKTRDTQDTTVTQNTTIFAGHLSVHPHILFWDLLISIKFHISWFSVVDA